MILPFLLKNPMDAHKKIVQEAALSRYTNPIYQKDTLPYYGPAKPFRAIVQGPGDHVDVKVTLGPLEERLPTVKNIRELTKQLNHLNERIEGPKYMTHDTKGRAVYFKDPKAYYDPSLADKLRMKNKLQRNINELRTELNSNNRPTLIIGKAKASVKIQNFMNHNKEETNEFIAKSYYYPVNKQKLAFKRVAELGQARTNLRKEENNNEHQSPINIYTRTPENIIIGSPNKYYDRTDTEVVEAESTGVKIDRKYYYEDAPKQNLNPAQTIRRIMASNNFLNNNIQETKINNSNLIGVKPNMMKTAKFRILPRKK